MEGAQRQLSARLTNTLSGNYTYRCEEVNQMATGKVSAIAPLADTLPGQTAEGRPDMNPGESCGYYFTRLLLINLFVVGYYGFPVPG